MSNMLQTYFKPLTPPPPSGREGGESSSVGQVSSGVRGPPPKPHEPEPRPAAATSGGVTPKPNKAETDAGGLLGQKVLWEKGFTAGFFLTSVAEKTKTQVQNSRKKLKQKTQPLGGLSLPYAKLKKKLNFMKLSHQNSKFSKGWRFLHHFY